MEGQDEAIQAVENIAQPPELFKVFPLDEQAGGGSGNMKIPAGSVVAGGGENTFRI